jgi:phage tail-like protein
MTDAPVSDDHMKMIDSLSANEFAIEIDGQEATGIFRVSGLVSFKLNTKTAQTKLETEPFQISKMVQRDPNLPFSQWLRATFDAGDDIERPTRAVAVVAIDDGVETRRWTVTGAYITEVSYSEFNTASGDLIEETVTIEYEALEAVWSLL